MTKHKNKFTDWIWRILFISAILTIIGMIVLATGVHFYHQGVQTGRNEVITMAVRHHHAYWVVNNQGEARLEWRLLHKIEDSCVRYDKD